MGIREHTDPHRSLCVCARGQDLLWRCTAHHCYGIAPQGGCVCWVWLMRQPPPKPFHEDGWLQRKLLCFFSTAVSPSSFFFFFFSLLGPFVCSLFKVSPLTSFSRHFPIKLFFPVLYFSTPPFFFCFVSFSLHLWLRFALWASGAWAETGL